MSTRRSRAARAEAQRIERLRIQGEVRHLRERVLAGTDGELGLPDPPYPPGRPEAPGQPERTNAR
jgi:hypothetical protein